MSTDHPLRQARALREIVHAVSVHLGREWTVRTWRNLDDRACHPCGILADRGFAVFAKFSAAPDANHQFATERRGLDLLTRRAGVPTPAPVSGGVLDVGTGTVLLLEAVRETPPRDRTPADWRAIGRALATVHQATGDRFGLDGSDGFFGPLAQDNRPVHSNRWADFYAERRLAPRLRSAVDSGHLPAALATGVERVIARLPELCGPEPRPALTHGDAQQHNFLSGPDGAVLIDPAPYFGHPEVDLAFVDYFEPVPDEVFDAYREVAPVDSGFTYRRELWRLHGYLAVVTVDGTNDFGRAFLDRIAAAVAGYR